MNIGTDDLGCEYCDATTEDKGVAIYECDRCGVDCCSEHCEDDLCEEVEEDLLCSTCFNESVRAASEVDP